MFIGWVVLLLLSFQGSLHILNGGLLFTMYNLSTLCQTNVHLRVDFFLQSILLKFNSFQFINFIFYKSCFFKSKMSPTNSDFWHTFLVYIFYSFGVVKNNIKNG